jgi:hypothetical protein
MRADDLDAPLSFLSDALEALEELPRYALSAEQDTQFGNLQSRLRALVKSGEIFQRRLDNGVYVHRAHTPVAPLEELGDL